jgi:hypothetical protein
VGGRVHRFAIGQRPDLTATKPRAGHIDDTGATDPAIRIVVLTLLAVDGVLSALAGALLLPIYIGSVPFPISALISGLVNAALVWAAGRWTKSARLAALPLWTWLLTIAAMSLGGPGDDVILLMDYRPLLLLVLGVAPAVWVLWHRRARS